MNNCLPRAYRFRALTFIAAFALFVLTAAAQVPFTIQGPGVDPAQFRITRFATNNFVLGMAELSDHSILSPPSVSPPRPTRPDRMTLFTNSAPRPISQPPPRPSPFH